MRIFELFDQTVPFIERQGNITGTAAYDFEVNGNNYRAVIFSHDGETFEFMFDLEDNTKSMEATNLRDQYAVLGTIASIVVHHLTKYKPEELIFTGHAKKGKVYSQMLKRLPKSLPYDISQKQEYGGTYFNLTRRD